MLKQVEQGLLYQETVVYQIKDTFGEDFVYTNENGNLAISKAVLRAFRGISGDKVVWERAERLWRLRNSFDAPGQRQQD